MAKGPKKEAKKFKFKFKLNFSPSKLLNKRVKTIGKGKLGRDVKTPRWLKAVGGYIKGSYQELRQVRWPSRKASWGLTISVILFTVVLVAFILLLDYGFEMLFKKVIL
jgi:preprotein translocase SecE subunit